jgi:hypothetical protein
MKNGEKLWQKPRPTQGNWGAAAAANNYDTFCATGKRKIQRNSAPLTIIKLKTINTLSTTLNFNCKISLVMLHCDDIL